MPKLTFCHATGYTIAGDPNSIWRDRMPMGIIPPSTGAEIASVQTLGSNMILPLADLWTVVSHNWALVSIVLTITLLVVVPFLILAKYVRICLNILRDTEPPLSIVQHGTQIPPGEEIDFFAQDGIRLRGCLVQSTAPGPKRGFVLFAPEFKSNRLSFARYCRGLLDHGYDIFSFDFRGHGKSASEEGYTPRQWASDRELTDIRAALTCAEAWLEQQGRPVRLGVFGISRGACAGLLAAEGNDTIRAMIVDGAFSSDCTLEHLMRRWAKIFAKVRIIYENHPPEFWRFLRWCLFVSCRIKLGCTFPSVRKVLGRMTPRPVLFIHGERDSYIPVEQSRLLYALSAQPKYLWIVPGAKHNQSVAVEPDEYARRTVEFFDRYLAGIDDPNNMYHESRFAELALGELAYSLRSDANLGYAPRPTQTARPQ